MSKVKNRARSRREKARKQRWRAYAKSLFPSSDNPYRNAFNMIMRREAVIVQKYAERCVGAVLRRICQ